MTLQNSGKDRKSTMTWLAYFSMTLSICLVSFNALRQRVEMQAYVTSMAVATIAIFGIEVWLLRRSFEFLNVKKISRGAKIFGRLFLFIASASLAALSLLLAQRLIHSWIFSHKIGAIQNSVHHTNLESTLAFLRSSMFSLYVCAAAVFYFVILKFEVTPQRSALGRHLTSVSLCFFLLLFILLVLGGLI